VINPYNGSGRFLMSNRKIISLAIGKSMEYTWRQSKEQSAIGKTAVTTAQLKKEGFIGDGVANTEFHGGVDRAVCIYPFEHYSRWEKIFNKKLRLPAFGENITAIGMTEAEVHIGDIYKIGDTVIQVTQGRVPCSTISSFNQEKDFLKLVFETSLTGYFFRVIEEGTINIDSKIELAEQHPMKISVFFAAQTLFHSHDQKAIEKILQVEEMALDWKQRFLKLV
jgi:MOSC domain-containing protein YiiM